MATEKLSAYWQKRNFGETPEPKGKVAKKGAALQFVVQKHAARRLHYDFRLELDGTLKSWAVPKGPSLDPADKRLAVHVEDHPLDYADFEGVIPPKHYGAGTVIVWDRGSWQPDTDPHAAYQAGKLKFHLQGEKLTGGWMLVRTRLVASGDKEQWLLIKERDEAARKHDDFDITEALPDSVLGKQPARRKPAKSVSKQTMPKGSVPVAMPAKLKPQLATLLESPPKEAGWIYEIKFDGYRLLARVDEGKVRLFTRNGHDWTSKLPALAQAVSGLAVENAWLDGEIVVLDDKGAPRFGLLQNAFDNGRADHVVFFLFDLPYLDGHDLRRSALQARRQLLRSLVQSNASPLIRFSDDFAGAPARILAQVCELSLEGLIGKRKDAAYTEGRSRTWIKLKCQRRQEFVIGGYSDPQGSRTGFGALLLGVNEADGSLRYAGRVGTGFDDKRLQSLHSQLQKLATDKPPFVNPPKGMMARGVHWVRPTLVAEVSFGEWTADGVVRHAVFQGLRTDKPATAIGREVVGNQPSQRTAKAAPPANADKRPTGATGPSKPIGETVANVKISHPERVIDTVSGVTKLELARYYHAVAPWMLGHLKGRPVALLRGPNGIAGELFFQKHADKLSIPGVRNLDRSLDPDHAPLMVIETVGALVGAAQMGTVELHTWNATEKAIERPDRIIFDLDPDPALPWSRMVEAATLTKTLLDELGLKSFLKTSGGKGVHVVVPLARRHDWETAKSFSQAVAQHLASALPQRFSARMGAQNRIKKVFVDYLRNNRGSSTVAAYSARARPGMAVSVPISWAELGMIEGADKWNLRTLPERLAALRNDPWADYEQSRQTLTKAIKKLAAGKK